MQASAASDSDDELPSTQALFSGHPLGEQTSCVDEAAGNSAAQGDVTDAPGVAPEATVEQEAGEERAGLNEEQPTQHLDEDLEDEEPVRQKRKRRNLNATIELQKKVQNKKKATGTQKKAVEGSTDEFEVSAIVDHKCVRKGSLQFRVRWKFYSEEDDTWESEENLLSAPKIVEAYKRRNGLLSRAPGVAAAAADDDDDADASGARTASALTTREASTRTPTSARTQRAMGRLRATTPVWPGLPQSAPAPSSRGQRRAGIHALTAIAGHFSPESVAASGQAASSPSDDSDYVAQPATPSALSDSENGQDGTGPAENGPEENGPEEDSEYEVEAILSHSGKPGHFTFEVCWKGYQKPTWEPYAALAHLAREPQGLLTLYAKKHGLPRVAAM